MKPPLNFDGSKFALKFGLNAIPPSPDFWIDANGDFQCPSLPNLTETDLLDCIADAPSPYQVFVMPLKAPAIYVEDIFVSSRKIKDDPDEALDEAFLESEKAHGEPKSLDLISRSTAKNVMALRQRVRDLESLIDKLEKRIKKLEK